jgi:hypothetical protein
MFADVGPSLENAKIAYEHVYNPDSNDKYNEMDNHETFTIEFVPENLPLENSKGTAFEDYVKKMATETTGLPPPEPTVKEPPVAEEILIFSAQDTDLCAKIIENAPEGKVGSKKMVSKPCKLIEKADIDSLLSNKQYDLVIIGCTLDAPKSDKVEDIINAQNDVVKMLLLLCQKAYLTEGSIKRMVILTNDVFSEQAETYKARGLGMTTHGWAYGYANTLRQEVEFPVQLIDIEDINEPELIPFIVDEIFRESTFGLNTVRLCYPYPIKDGILTGRPTGRYVIRQRTSHEYEKANRLEEMYPHPTSGIIGIAGGNGALGLVMGKWMLRRALKKKEEDPSYNPTFKIQFLSRSVKLSDINMPLWEEDKDLAAKIGTVTVEQAKLDLSTQENCDEYVKGCDGKLIGFVHSAGILQDSMLPNQTWEKFKGVFASKHWAALYLHDAFERIPQPGLKFYWMFSSVSVYGNMGQLNYSASNGYLDCIARYRRNTGRPACAMQWGAWGEVGMAATMDDAMRRRVMMGPMPYFTVEQGLQGMERGLQSGLPGFSTFIVQPGMMFGMVAGGTSPQSLFYSGFVPLSAPQSFDSVYDNYRMYMYLFKPIETGEKLYYDRYCKPHVKDGDVDEEDGVREVGGYGGP